jgi:carbonic anhydrase/acetyltransferase-like protein (isoleucine patch superfamily)
MERYSNIPITKLAIVQPPDKGFPGIRPYGIAGILSYIKTVIHRHVEIGPDEEWEKYDDDYYLGETRVAVDYYPQDESILVSLSFSPVVEHQAIEDIRKDLSKNASVVVLEDNIKSSYQIRFQVTGVNVPEDNEDFFNLPPETHDFGDGNFEVPAHRHINPDGSRGGWVAETASVDSTVFVAPDAKVYGNAQVSLHAQVSDNAKISGGNISGNTQISGTAQISGGFIAGTTHVSGGNISAGIIVGNAQVSGGTISGGVISGGTISGNIFITGRPHILGGKISGNARIGGDAIISEGANITSGKITNGTYP